MLKIMIDKKTGKIKKLPIVILALFIVVIFVSALALNMKSNNDMEAIIQDSIKDQLISVALASLEMLDVDKFVTYNSMEDIEADNTDYSRALENLRSLAVRVNASYIYALKYVDGQYIFVFDTDLSDNNGTMKTYELSPVHKRAFMGVHAADVMNVADEYGSFNTGAVPIYRNGVVVGIICVDIEDSFLVRAKETSTRNIIILAAILLVILGCMMVFLIYLLKKVGQMQDRMRNMAHNDVITGLPNRQYLFEYLNNHVETQKDVPFALLFIDLDNFKKVNDNAGHDAGDELLIRIARFLQSTGDSASATFHPSAGLLNVSARVGGDEFIQIVPGAATMEDATVLADKLYTEFKPDKISRYIEKYGVGLSVGVALYPFHSDNYHVLIKYADTAMYKAKKGGKNRYCIYDDDLNVEISDFV